MSFTRDVKLELCTLLPETEHCRKAELSGLLYGAGTFEIGAGSRYGVRMSLGMPAITRHVLALLKPFDVDAEVRTVDSAPIGLRFEVVLTDEARGLQLLNELGALSDALRVQMLAPRRLLKRHCCVVAFLRGLFLGCGSVSAPGAPVHVEFTVADEDLASQVQGLLARLGLTFGLVVRDRNAACYTKRSETAAGLLAVLGAHDACLRWEEHEVLGRVRERANRLANCDAANARRAAAAGEKQAALVRRLMSTPGWTALPTAVRDAGELRVAFPYLSLQELAERATPPLSKSAMNHRMRRLLDLADQSETCASWGVPA
jgi:DNA-binding protein WhiA